MSEEISIINDDQQDWLSIPLPGAEGVLFKVLKADSANNRVVMKIRFGAGTRLPRHVHHCRAVAYTVNGEWEYDEGSFTPGHVAYEHVGNDHTPSSGPGSELFLFFDSDDGRFLDNYLEDGTIVRMNMPFFAAFEGLSAEAAAQVEIHETVEFNPVDAAA